MAALTVLLSFHCALFLSNIINQDTGQSPWVQVVRNAKTAVVLIETDKHTASGFFVKPDGTILTNYHVIEGINDIRIKTSSQELFNRVQILACKHSAEIDFSPAYTDPAALSDKNSLIMERVFRRIGMAIRP
jgi:hypothetical protein